MMPKNVDGMFILLQWFVWNIVITNTVISSGDNFVIFLKSICQVPFIHLMAPQPKLPLLSGSALADEILRIMWSGRAIILEI